MTNCAFISILPTTIMQLCKGMRYAAAACEIKCCFCVYRAHGAPFFFLCVQLMPRCFHASGSQTLSLPCMMQGAFRLGAGRRLRFSTIDADGGGFANLWVCMFGSGQGHVPSTPATNNWLM